MTFGERLRTAMDQRGPLCIGIDPHPSLLTGWGLTDDANGLEKFALTVVEAFADTMSVMKPQSAFFERHGSKGIAVLERTLAGIREGGAIALLDAKRGDIGSTVQAYADAYLRPESPLFADALTASPYLGFGSLQPLFDAANANDCGVFVLALTSNPEGMEVQRTAAGRILDHIAETNRGAEPMGSIGAVVGATIDEEAQRILADHAVRLNGPILVPGVGAQGGTAEDLRRVFGAMAGDVIPSTSRGVLQAGPDIAALRAAADRELQHP